MIAEAIAPAWGGLGIGIALAGAPGPVQAILLTESVSGGVGQGLRALAGVHATFGTLMVCLALGLSIARPGGAAVRILKVVGGAFLLWLAADGLRSRSAVDRAWTDRRALPPAVRGSLAILLNPGGWLFLGAVASPLLAIATRQGGTPSALLTALGLVGGAALGDVIVVLLGGLGLRRAGDGVGRWVRRALAIVLAGLGVWLIVAGVVG